MANLTIQNLPDSIWKPLAARAARHGRSVEEEAVDLLGLVVSPENRRGAVERNLQTLNEFRESLADLFIVEEKNLRPEKRDESAKPSETEI
jgi:plasmid stability protein